MHHTETCKVRSRALHCGIQYSMQYILAGYGTYWQRYPGIQAYRKLAHCAIHTAEIVQEVWYYANPNITNPIHPILSSPHTQTQTGWFLQLCCRSHSSPVAPAFLFHPARCHSASFNLSFHGDDSRVKTVYRNLWQ